MEFHLSEVIDGSDLILSYERMDFREDFGISIDDPNLRYRKCIDRAIQRDEIELCATEILDHGMSEFESTNHEIVRDLVSLTFDHRDRIESPCDGEVEMGILELFEARIEDEIPCLIGNNTNP